MLLKIFPENPSDRKMRQIIDTMHSGGIVIFPTDTVYGLGCDINQSEAAEKIAHIKKQSLSKSDFSLICSDLSQVTGYTKQIEKSTFKLIKKNLPGPFTFILEANNNIPKIFRNRKKTIGIRIPDNPIPREIARQLDNPIITTSILDEDKIVEYTTNPELIHERYKHIVDIVIDGGISDNKPSTVVDCTKEFVEIIREGKSSLIEP